jgi:hypothetical protein
VQIFWIAKPSDLVGAAIFLASGASDFVTGQTLFVDGGFTTLTSLDICSIGGEYSRTDHAAFASRFALAVGNLA